MGEHARYSSGRKLLIQRLMLRRHGLRSLQRHIDIFEQGLIGDALYTIRKFDEIIAGLARLFAAEGIGEDNWFGELTSTHQKTGAVDGPLTLSVHSILRSLRGEGCSHCSHSRDEFHPGTVGRTADKCVCKWSDSTRTNEARSIP